MLPASVLRQMQNGIITHGLTTTVLWATKSGGSFGAPVSVTVCVKDDGFMQELVIRQNERQNVRRVTLEVMQQGVSAKLGDQVTYAGVAMILDVIDGLDVPVWQIVLKTPIGVQGKSGGLRAGGGGT